MFGLNFTAPGHTAKAAWMGVLSKSLTAGLALSTFAGQLAQADDVAFTRGDGYVRFYPAKLNCSKLPCTVRVPGTFIVVTFRPDASFQTNVDLIGATARLTLASAAGYSDPYLAHVNMDATIDANHHASVIFTTGRDDFSTSSNYRSFYVNARGARSLSMSAGSTLYYKHSGSSSADEILNGQVTQYESIDVSVADMKISEDLKIPTYTLARDFAFALDQLQSFENGMKKSDRPHVVRLRRALTDALETMIDKSGNARLPVTHSRVQENARVVLVLSTVLNEIMDDYGVVDSLTIPIQALETLESEIRLSYGWDEGMAGSGSKALAAISDGLDVILRNLYRSSAAFGAARPEPFSALQRANVNLNAAVRATKGGDMHATAQVAALTTAWNSPEWQAQLSQLLDAPADFQNLVQGQLKIMLEEVESIAELSGQNFTITDKLQNVKKQ